MASIKYIQPYGNQLVVVMDDGTKVMALPTGMDMWLVSGTGPSPSHGDFVWPFSLASANSSNGHPGDNFRTSQRPNHDGMDFSYGGASKGANMPAAAAGIVEVSGVYFGYGNTVIINHGVHGGKVCKTLYGHMQDGSLTKAVGSQIAQCETMGKVGTTGQSFGEHLHLETWLDGVKVDPLIFMATYNPTNAYCVA